MGVVSLLKLLLTLVQSLAAYARDKKLMDAGAAQAILKGVEDANEAIAKANDARAHAGELPVESDPNNRDAGK